MNNSLRNMFSVVLPSRKFIRTFNLADNMEVKTAKLQNGLLIVNLEFHIPESQKPKKIEIAKS
jgi:molecular chaperone IbpA